MAVYVAAGDPERLCQYLCRPPLGQDRLHRLRDGRIAGPWADGTTHLVFTPVELLERLVPLVPRPRINLVLYHGVLAPNAPWRREVVARAEPEVGTLDPFPASAPAGDPSKDANADSARPRYRAWADLMRRAFAADVLACPRCGGRMTVLATIEDPAVIQPERGMPSRAQGRTNQAAHRVLTFRCTLRTVCALQADRLPRSRDVAMAMGEG